jgi:hypothetical protein
VSGTLEEFIKERIPDNRKAEFRGMIEKLGVSSVTGDYMGLAILAMIHSENTESLANYMTDETIRDAISSGNPLTNTQLIYAFIDFITANDIERQETHYGRPVEEVRARVKDYVENYLTPIALKHAEKIAPGITELLKK